MGRRVNLADLAAEPVFDAPVPRAPAVGGRVTVAVSDVAANPLNPRDDLGDLVELATSMTTMGQLQPCTVVTRSAYLSQYPEHSAAIGDAEYVAITGNRRRAAAAQAGLSTLDIVVKDDLARSREQLAAATIAENIERRDFDVIEEARAVQMLVTLCGSGTLAAERLARTKGWVSQRLALLRLSEPMRQLVRAGELPVRDARRLAQLDPDRQLPAWDQERARRDGLVEDRFTAVNRDTEPTQPPSLGSVGSTPRMPSQRQDGDRNLILRAIRRLGGTPSTVATNLKDHFDADQIRELVAILVSDIENP